MGALAFPNADAFRLALANGFLSPELANSPVRAGCDRFGRLWVLTDESLPQGAIAGVARLGVTALAPAEHVEFQDYLCWHHVVPLTPVDFVPPSGVATLMQMPDHLASVIAGEMQRLSLEQRDIRILECAENESSVYLHVVDPPLFSLLRATHRNDLKIYVERAPRVWVEAGWQHPLAHLLPPPRGASLLIRAPKQWRYLPYEFVPPATNEFSLPVVPASKLLRDGASPMHLSLPLQLVAATPADPPEVWVIETAPLEQLRTLAERVSDSVLAQWDFAIFDTGDRSTAILRAHAAKTATDLMLNGTGCVRYMRLPNLFVPTGMTLQPALRRDQARRWFSKDEGLLTLLLQDQHGRPAIKCVDQRHFRPLMQFCTYEVPNRVALRPSPPRRLLPFDLFSITVEPPTPPTLVRPPSIVPTPVASQEPVVAPGLLARLRRMFQSDEPPSVGPSEQEVTDAIRTALPDPPAPSAAGDTSGRRLKHQRRRAQLEARMLQILGPESSAQRCELWPQLAGAHSDLGQFTDAAACWLNALWEHRAPPALWLRGWLQAEKMLSRVPLLEDDLAALLDMHPGPTNIRTLAACVVWLSHQPEPAPALVAHARHIQQRLEQHEHWLPARSAWLAHCCLTRLAGGDVLALARTRDRILERLNCQGLSLEQDVPSFLRFGGPDTGAKFPAVRDWLQRIRDVIHRWIDALVSHRPADYSLTFGSEFPDRDGKCTKAYVDLLLAWGLARLGEATTAKHQRQAGWDVLTKSEATETRILLHLFDHRIQQALETRPQLEPLPNELLGELDRLAATPLESRRVHVLYTIESLRHRSRILDPTGQTRSHRRLVLARFSDGIEQEMAQWPDVASNDELARRIAASLGRHTDDLRVVPALLDAALPMAARIGEKRTLPLLERAEQLLDVLPLDHRQMLLLEQTLAATTHFSMAALGRRFAGRLSRLLRPRTLDLALVINSCRMSPEPELLERIESWPGRCLRWIRKLGLDAEADRLWPRFREWILASGSLPKVRGQRLEIWLPVLRTMLNLIGDQPSEVNDEAAAAALDLARKQLLYGRDMRNDECAALACAYVAALGRSPIRMAQGRIEELFRDLTRLHDAGPVNAYFALSPLRLVDGIVRAVANEDFVLSPAVRRWLSEDEFRVRRRMQDDLQNLLAKHGP